jgi:hypothetical protein
MRTIVELSALGLAVFSVVRGGVIAEANAATPPDGWKWMSLAAAPTDSTGLDRGFLVTGDHTTALGSAEGIAWAPRPVVLLPIWRSAVRGHGMVVGIDHQGQIHTTPDGLTWTRRGSGTPSSLHSAAFGHGRFVAVGNEGAVVTSTDAVTWTACDAGMDERLRGVAFGNGRFVAVGYAGTILTSRDGTRWTQRPSGTDVRLQDIAYGHGTFIAVGWQGVILASQSGTEWTRRRSGTSSHLRRVAFGEARSLTNAAVLSVRSPGCNGEHPAAPLMVLGPPGRITATNQLWRPFP